MTCKIEAGPGWNWDGGSEALLCNQGKNLVGESTTIQLVTGGMDEGTKIYFDGNLNSLPHALVGKVKPWTSPMLTSCFRLYGNGANVSILEPESPFYLKVTNLPKVKSA